MARYNVLLTTIDGQATNVSVDANSISEARRKAESQYVGSRASGVPELAASPVGSDSFSSFVGGIDSNYNPSAYGMQNPAVSIPNPISADLANQLAFANSQANTGSNTPQYVSPYGEQYDPLFNAGYSASNRNDAFESADLANQLTFANSQANTGANTPQFSSMYGEQYPGNYDPMAGGEKSKFDYNRMVSGVNPLVYDPMASGYNEVDEANEIERFRRLSMSNPVPAGFDTQAMIGESQGVNQGFDIDASEAKRFAADQRKQDQENRETLTVL